jgi:uncharacterized protein (TIGR00251 family)
VIEERADGVVLAVRVKPRASRDAILGFDQGVLVVRLRAPPVEGEANAALQRVLGRALEVAPSAVRLLSGATGRRKRVHVKGIAAADARARLLAVSSLRKG